MTKKRPYVPTEKIAPYELDALNACHHVAEFYRTRPTDHDVDMQVAYSFASGRYHFKALT